LGTWSNDIQVRNTLEAHKTLSDLKKFEKTFFGMSDLKKLWTNLICKCVISKKKLLSCQKPGTVPWEPGVEGVKGACKGEERLVEGKAADVNTQRSLLPAKKWGDTEIAKRGRSVLVMRARYRSAGLTPHQRGWTDAGLMVSQLQLCNGLL